MGQFSPKEVELLKELFGTGPIAALKAYLWSKIPPGLDRSTVVRYMQLAHRMAGNDPTGTQHIRWLVLAKTLAKMDIMSGLARAGESARSGMSIARAVIKGALTTPSGLVGTGVATVGGAAVLVTALSSPLGNGDLPANIQAEIDGRRRNEEIVRAETLARTGRAGAASKESPDERKGDDLGGSATQTPISNADSTFASMPYRDLMRPMPLVEPRPVYREVQQPVYRQQMPVLESRPPVAYREVPVYREMPVYREQQPMPIYQTQSLPAPVEFRTIKVEEPKQSKSEKVWEAIAIGAAIAVPMIVQGVSGNRVDSSPSTPKGLCPNPAYDAAMRQQQASLAKGDPVSVHNAAAASHAGQGPTYYPPRYIPCTQ